MSRLASLLLTAATTTVVAGCAATTGAADHAADAAPDAPEVVVRAAPRVSDACPRMPTFGLARPRTRRPLDFDSIRALPPETADSLAAAGALPRLDTLVVIPEARAFPMPMVPLDSAGLPIRVVPLCRVTGTGR